VDLRFRVQSLEKKVKDLSVSITRAQGTTDARLDSVHMSLQTMITQMARLTAPPQPLSTQIMVTTQPLRASSRHHSVQPSYSPLRTMSAPDGVVNASAPLCLTGPAVPSVIRPSRSLSYHAPTNSGLISTNSNAPTVPTNSLGIQL